MRARIIPLTIAGLLTLTTGVALAETNPADPEVVEVPVDGTTTTTTTTVTEPTTTTTETTVAPPETTTTTTEPEPEPEEDVVGGEAAAVHPENHGSYVSQAAHDKAGAGRHGAAVSAVARSDAGKPGKGGAPEA